VEKIKRFFHADANSYHTNEKIYDRKKRIGVASRLRRQKRNPVSPSPARSSVRGKKEIFAKAGPSETPPPPPTPTLHFRQPPPANS